jgi:uncharacterized membrane protein YqiK
MCMNWMIVTAGIVVVAFIGLGLLWAAFRDRERGQEVVEDLDERTSQAPEEPGAQHGRGL